MTDEEYTRHVVAIGKALKALNDAAQEAVDACLDVEWVRDINGLPEDPHKAVLTVYREQLTVVGY